jgi:chitinase
MPYWAQAPYGSCTDATAYQLMSVEPSDADNLATIVGFRASNPSLRLVLSVGGWNYPSEYFSRMVSTPATRATFIASVAAWLAQYSANGVSIDWEYPCSPPRADPVEITCTDFQVVADAGGKCPDDGTNLVELLKEMRAGLPAGTIITIASQAGAAQEREMKVSSLHPYVDRLEVMTYDYSVSDIPNAGVIAPAAPLYNPPNISGVPAWSINYTVHDYLADGVPPAKIIIGAPLYGHTWFNPTLAADDAWATFGQASYVQGACCGPFASTSGGKPGQGCAMCGTMMYSEVMAAAPDKMLFDNITQSNIAYFTKMGADAWTTPGTWVSYNDAQSMAAITAYARAYGLGGVFCFDTSMDSRNAAGDFTYELMNAIANGLDA